MARLLSNATAKALETVLNDTLRKSGFIDTKTHAVEDRRVNWLYITAKLDGIDFAYEADAYAFFEADDALVEDVKVINVGQETTAEELPFYPRWCKPLDFMYSDGEGAWFYLVDVSVGEPAVGEFQHQNAYMVSANQAGWSFQRAHGLP